MTVDRLQMISANSFPTPASFCPNSATDGRGVLDQSRDSAPPFPLGVKDQK